MTSTPFPSLLIQADELEPRGSFAEAQAAFLEPDPKLVAELERLLRRESAGVVAHFYMDPELQGVLAACDWPHLHVSDSLLMADRAVEMVREGAKRIVVLGVDFMSENVRAILDGAGLSDVPVHRVSDRPIGCSLAEAAEAKAYGAYLMGAAKTPRSLHVVYINTSLRTKAKAHHLVPTITCTSSNVVRTVLQAASQVEDIHIFFGPDTYMGGNLRTLLQTLSEMSDEEVAKVHPAHTAASVRALLPRFHFFEEGTCIVHHLFGKEIVDQVRTDYPRAWVAAHLEVPGEMFALGLEASREGRGVTGSTANILSFVDRALRELIESGSTEVPQLILGTEAGMVTPIVRRVQRLLREAARPDLAVELVFPVASEAIAQTGQSDLIVVPGVSGGEGCSTSGGCATCPYMKMNSLQALLDVLNETDLETLRPYEPRKYREEIAGRTMADLGSEPILHMRALHRDGVLSEALVEDILSRGAP